MSEGPYDYARERRDAEWHARPVTGKHEAKYGLDAPTRAECEAEAAGDAE